jgi:hypothetical protein
MCVIALGMREREDEMGEQKENEKRKKGKKMWLSRRELNPGLERV